MLLDSKDAERLLQDAVFYALQTESPAVVLLHLTWY